MQQPTVILLIRRVLIPLCFLFLFQVCLIGQDDSAPAIQLCGSDNTFCVEDPIFDICVNIIIPPGFNEPIDSFVINWGDGSTLTLPGNFDTYNVITYSFDFSSFINGTEFSTNEFEIKLTGKQGDVMKESVHCSYTAGMNYIGENLDKFKNINK